ncbi:O-methyltransferase [Streptomyces pinistramenti]|uniref:O-methyltransferase n=1 Tax=Streptomyces pinistramenti TaxID=2884812 RepID=UPI001D075D56|nr:class I SAM-dependent methyltransferase [Streptomyces pinistramenti]MCB5906173.1 class I SAM-dependent methyltransferase [Streptomyces pinistramenti]
MDDSPLHHPAAAAGIRARNTALGFHGSCQDRTGALLRTLAALKPGGRLLELGTGTGAGTAWILDGMSSDAHLVTVERDPELAAVASDLLRSDHRVEFTVDDLHEWMPQQRGQTFDFVFVDCRLAKQHHETVLGLLRPGAVYVADDLHPGTGWGPQDVVARDEYLATLAADPRLRPTLLDWSSGLVVAAVDGHG